MLIYNLGRGAVARTARVMRATHRTGFTLPNGLRIKRSRDHYLSMEDTAKMANAIVSGMENGYIGVKDDNGRQISLGDFRRFADWASEEKPANDPMDLEGAEKPEDDDPDNEDLGLDDDVLLPGGEVIDDEPDTSSEDLDDSLLLDDEVINDEQPHDLDDEPDEDVGDDNVLEDEELGLGADPVDDKMLEDAAGEHPAEFLEEEVLQKMSRADLNVMAEDRSLDPEDYKNKTAVINALLSWAGAE